MFSKKEIIEYWPKDVPYSDESLEEIHDLIQEWKVKNIDRLKIYIKNMFLKFEPSTEEFTCENYKNRWLYGFNYGGPHTAKKIPPLTQECSGGYRNVRKADSFS